MKEKRQQTDPKTGRHVGKPQVREPKKETDPKTGRHVGKLPVREQRNRTQTQVNKQVNRQRESQEKERAPCKGRQMYCKETKDKAADREHGSSLCSPRSIFPQNYVSPGIHSWSELFLLISRVRAEVSEG